MSYFESETYFKLLAIRNPSELINIIHKGGLKPSSLTFAAESLGLISDSSSAVSWLLELLKHTSSLVREGAIYGLEKHLNYPGVRESIINISQHDPAEGVREAASEVIL